MLSLPTLYFSLFSFLIHLLLIPKTEELLKLEFCQYEEKILLQAAGLYHLGVLCLDLGSLSLFYKNLFVNFWACYKPCFFSP